MNRAQKAEFVEGIRQRFEQAPLVVLTDFKGSTVAEMDALRRACEPLGLHYEVVKNTLCIRAVSGTPHESLTDEFRGNTGVLFSGEDPVAAAKLLKEQAKDNKNLVVKAGFFEGDVIDAAGVAAVAELPSKEELQVQLLQTLLAAPRNVMQVIRAPARDLLYLLNNYANKLEEAG